MRRYGDFEKVFKALAPVAKACKVTLPPFPKGGIRAFFSKNSEKVVGQRRLAFQQLLDFVCANAALYNRSIVMKFLRS